MVHLSNRKIICNSATAKPYGVFEQLDKEKKYYVFDEIRIAIEKETDRVAGGDKGIVDDPIKLTGTPIITLSILIRMPRSNPNRLAGYH